MQDVHTVVRKFPAFYYREKCRSSQAPIEQVEHHNHKHTHDQPTTMTMEESVRINTHDTSTYNCRISTDTDTGSHMRYEEKKPPTLDVISLVSSRSDMRSPYIRRIRPQFFPSFVCSSSQGFVSALGASSLDDISHIAITAALR